MSDSFAASDTRRELGQYELPLKGHLEARWATWFVGVSRTRESDGTVIRGSVIDQAALHGLLSKTDRRREVRDKFLAKLVMSPHTDLRHTLGLLDQQVEIYSAHKHELEARRAEAQAANEVAGVPSLESGIRDSATDIEWATWCKAEINRRLSPEKDRS
jgi:Virulence activator alpha C-term